MAAPQHPSWEQEWDADVVAKLEDTASQDGLELLKSVEEWGEWGGLPGQPQSSPLLQLGEENKNGTTVGDLQYLSEDRMEDVGAPGISDSPPGTSYNNKVLTTWQSRPASQVQKSTRQVLPEKQDELREFLDTWHRSFAPLEDFMTSNEIALMSVVKKRTEEWIQKNGIYEPAECSSKKEYLKQILQAVEMRRTEWDRRPAAAEELSRATSAALSLCSKTLSSPQQPGLTTHELTCVQLLKEVADRTEQWLRTEVAAQLSKPKYADPVLLVDHLTAARSKLRTACIEAYGTDKLNQQRKVVSSVSVPGRGPPQPVGPQPDIENEQLIPAVTGYSQSYATPLPGQRPVLAAEQKRLLRWGCFACCIAS